VKAGTCAQGEQCNCDSSEEKWLNDEGFFTIPERLGITEMNFIYPKDLPTDAAARITLGPMECVEASMSFESSQNAKTRFIFFKL